MHFTYGEGCDKSSLKQGDLLKKTPELSLVLSKYHSYFAKGQYTHFLVLTQTCDLELREEKCKARYITLSAVRSLKDVINKQLTELQSVQVKGDGLFYSDAKKPELVDFLRKLHNNNDPHHFFLKASPENDLTNDSCAFLQLTVPIKAKEHYKTCCDAKRLELKEGFRAKLGYLVGDLYSRVGTEDYVPGALSDKSTFNKHLESTITDYVNMVPGKLFKQFGNYAAQNLSFEEIARKMEKDNKQSRENKLNSIVKLIKNVVTITPKEEEELKNSFAQDPTLKSFIDK
jgi:hypothetical protein